MTPVERELAAIFVQTMDAHFPEGVGVTRDAYATTFRGILREEVREAPALDTDQGTLATYVKLSVLALSMARQLEGYGLSEREIGERIYRTADAHFRLSPVRRRIKRTLFFSRLNRRQIQARQEATERGTNGVNGFRLRYVEGTGADAFGVDYLACGIRLYFERRGMSVYARYLCLVDYAIMANMGVAFRRTTTLADGGPMCDFRFAKSGPITAGWPPDGLAEFRETPGKT